MKLSLQANGVDSLKATYNSLENTHFLCEGVEHRVKDAILSLNHANEILFKFLLKQRSECLVFVDIKAYMNAKEEMRSNGKSNVFEVKPKLQTIGIFEAIKRLELLCDMDVCSYLKRSLDYLNKKRNQIMHYEINLNEGEFKAMVKRLEICYENTIRFFSQHIEGLSSLVEDARFELFEQDLIDDPDVEAMNDEAYFDYLADLSE
ncbi:hypothetical protein CHR37_04895 [Bacillus velezensis]|uniref:hypothetical protein n=1 Tax=Bacillus TaxID=1386 RepID=UPI000767FADC|nr:MULTISPECIES: hypothetical protein [Bacillus]AME08470.1 hypothetical protein AUL54_20085 [Bacillus sp. SDLI1]ATX84262.1 hypothetical protein CU084_11555 [Bacillus velezensis]MBN7742706.1 hypothetical protein [Bacillus velezensis]MCY0089225.1 hypothetical protein [Bacillus velezensis]OYD12297.1 hypothetical protein CHR37_04895 [Bacillus velezensis]